jgi:hypothetical protein
VPPLQSKKPDRIGRKVNKDMDKKKRQEDNGEIRG